jgi:phospholipase/lecithinase/hemolysin
MCKLFKHEQQETQLDTKNEKTNTLSWIFKTASSLKQQLGRYLVSLWNIILILTRPVFVLTP